MENRGEDVRDSGMARTVYETWEALFCTMRQKGIEEEHIWKVFVAEEQRMDISEELMQLIRSQSGFGVSVYRLRVRTYFVSPGRRECFM